MKLSKKDMKSIKRGAELARIHSKRIELHQMEHAVRHEVIENFDCTEMRESFYGQLAEEASGRNELFLASYNTTGTRIAKRLVKEVKKLKAGNNKKLRGEPNFEDFAKMFPGSFVVPMEPPREGETREQFVERLKKTAETEAAFREQVSETGPQVPTPPHVHGHDETIFDPNDDVISFTPEEEAAEPESEDTGEEQ